MVEKGLHFGGVQLYLLRVSLLMTFPQVLSTSPVARSIYFTELHYSTVIPDSLMVGDEVIVLHVHTVPSVRHPRATGADIQCALVGIPGRTSGRDIPTHDWSFYVTPNGTSGAVKILVANPLNIGLSTDRATYHLQVLCTDRTTRGEGRTDVTIDVTRSNERRHASLCHHDVTFQLAENVKNVVLGKLWCSSRDLCWPNATGNCNLTVHGSRNHKRYDDHLVLDEHGQLTVENSFDREETDRLTITYRCSVSGGSNTNAVVHPSGHGCRATLNILDTNDQGPWLQRINEEGKAVRVKLYETTTQLNDLKATVKELTSITTIDGDLPATNHYGAHLVNDYNRLFSVRTPRHSLASFYTTEVWINEKNNDFPTEISTFTVTVHMVDKSFIQSFNNEDNNTAVFRITVKLQSLWKPVVHHPEFPDVFISAAASLFSRVYYLGMNSTFYQIETISDDVYSDVSEAFAVTPREGVVYVNDARLLRELVNQSTVIVVSRCRTNTTAADAEADDDCSFFLNLTVTVGDSKTMPNYNLTGCSAFYLPSDCERAAGLGSPTGACVWRANESDPDSRTRYETCSPSLITCPDEHCDELEMNVTELCPQDCTTKSPDGIGWAELNYLYSPPRGIGRGQSPCWCKGNQCKCGRLSGNFTTNETELPGMAAIEGVERCGAICRLMLFVGVSSFLILALTIVVWKCFYYRRKMVRMRGHGSGIVPSDYVVQPGSVTTDYTDYTTGHLLDMNHQNFLDIEADPKWEFSRLCIKFENVLGEGEFGKVVRAQAWDIQGIPGYTTVAVKMLKECATGVEYRDLLSELNLLKQINHRNVIKLLAVCSRKGPLYVIVEFCEHGSLRSFLRRIREKKEYLETPHSLPNDISVIPTDDGGKLTSGINDEPRDLVENGVSGQDLLSFSWQIAKGMDYLGGMKVVHRDLAARNILLATGKVIKISDFGLSRDVYEGDAYLKTSKGPLPVKWMAPESLYEQICTTKSDVWSFGVVLWEIYTLGANPYPGTPAERLYQLLKTGYRMTKPPTCSDELFSVMLHCWTDDPSKRPTFNELADTFERFLSLDKNYLDLNACENLLPDEQSTSIPGNHPTATTDQISPELSSPKPAILVNGHYKQVPRATAIAVNHHSKPDDQSNSGEVSLTGSIPASFSGSSSTDSIGKTASLIPLQNAHNDRLNSLDHGQVKGQDNSIGTRAKPEVNEESNALLAFSTDF